MGNPILRITDGTDDGTVDLLAKKSGMRVRNWVPAIAEPKEGGLWQQSPFADGRQIVISRLGNVLETFEMSVVGETRNDIILATQKLRRLLNKARSYWTNKQQFEPVWIEARGDCEDHSRYAEIVDWRTPQDGNPFGSTFLSSIKPLFLDFPLIIERMHWKAEPPGTSTCLEISEGGYVSSYLEFDALATLINCGSDNVIDDLPAASMTAEAWVRADGFGEGNVGVIFDKRAAVTGWRFYIDNANGLIGFIDAGANDPLSMSGLAGFTADGLWHHVAMTYQDGAGNAIRLWVDGIEVDYTTQDPRGVAALDGDAARVLVIGNRLVGDQTWEGAIGWCRLSDSLRYVAATFTPPDICSPPYCDANTVAQWHFWEGEATSLVVKNYSQHNELVDGDITLGDGFWGLPDCPGYRLDTCDNEVFITNHHKHTQITDIYLDAGDAGVWSDNLVHEEPPFFLFTPLVEDMLYFGVDTSLEPSGPFSSLVFDINPVLMDMTVRWEYWGNAAWRQIADLRDNTDDGGDQLGEPFDTPGVGLVSWNLHEMAEEAAPNIWEECAVNGVTGWWVRAHVTAAGVAKQAPGQVNRRIYTVSWPYFEVDSDAVGGDIEALARHILDYQSYDGIVHDAILGDYYETPMRVIMGLRSNSRGENFTPYINLSDEAQNPAGITVTEYGAAAYVASIEAPTGRAIDWNQAIDPESFIAVTFDKDIVREYYGTYRAFLRLRWMSGLTQDQVFYLKIQDGSTFAVTAETVNRPYSYLWYYQMFDFGKINIPLNDLTDPNQTEIVPSEFIIFLTASFGAVLPTAVTRFYDLILMPTDEWAGEFTARHQSQVNGDSLAWVRKLDVDSVSIPKVDLRAVNRFTDFAATATFDSGEGYVSMWNTISPSKSFLQANSKQRMWVLSDEANSIAVPQFRVSYQEYCYAVQSYKNQQYYSMRGDR